MFRERVEKPIDPIPLVYANSLKRLDNEPDYSLTSLGIALLKNRIDGYGGISGLYYSFEDKASAMVNFVDRVKNVDTYPMYCYYIYTDNVEPSDAVKERLSEFKERKNITAFIKEKADSDCTVLYHEDKNIVGIFVNSRDFRMYHLLLSFISLYFPSLFKDHPMTEEDYALVRSLSNKEKDKFYETVKSLLSPYTLEFRRLQLTSLMKDIHEIKINNAYNTVSNARRDLANIEEQYGRMITALKQAIVVYEGLKATEKYDDPEEELVEYLANNKDIHDLNIENQNLYFSVTTLLNNYNEQAWKAFSSRGHIFDGQYGVHLPEIFSDINNRKILFNHIFSESPDLFVRMAGNYRLDLERCRVSTSSTYDYCRADPMFKDYVPNPHLKLFECLGGYKERVMPALRDRNYIAAVEICIASAGSVNLDEVQQTFRPFLGWILTNRNKILVTKDGKEMTPEEALVWLVDKEKENEAN